MPQENFYRKYLDIFSTEIHTYSLLLFFKFILNLILQKYFEKASPFQEDSVILFRGTDSISEKLG